jgi:hypothetical protein
VRLRPALLLAAVLTAAPAAAQEALDLRPRYTLGDKQETEGRVTVVLDVRMRVEAANLDSTSQMEQVTHRRFRDELTKVEGGKTAEVERTFVSAWSGLRDAGAPTLKRDTDSMHRRTIVIRRTPDGKKKVSPKRGSLPAADIQGEPLTERYEAALPKEPQAVGASWTVEGKDFVRALGRGLGDKPQGSMRCTLREVAQELVMPKAGLEPVAIIDLEVNASATRGEAADAPQLSAELKGELRFSLKRKKVVAVHLRGQARMRQTRSEEDVVMLLEGQGPMEIRKRTWFPAKPKRR